MPCSVLCGIFTPIMSLCTDYRQVLYTYNFYIWIIGLKKDFVIFWIPQHVHAHMPKAIRTCICTYKCMYMYVRTWWKKILIVKTVISFISRILLDFIKLIALYYLNLLGLQDCLQRNKQKLEFQTVVYAYLYACSGSPYPLFLIPLSLVLGSRFKRSYIKIT